MTSVSHLAPLAVVVPMLGATTIAGLSFLPRRVHELTAIAAALASTVMCALLLAHTQHGPIVYWLGHWVPHHGVAIGISLTVDQVGAGIATLTGVLVVASLVYSTRYFDEIEGPYYALILTYLTFGLPLSIWLLKGFYDNIPPELERAARIDGATRFKAFWLIVMPLSAPGIIATGIFTFIGAWNEYVYASTFLNTDRLKTLQPGLQKFFGEFSTNWPGLMAAQFVSSVPVVILFLVLQKYFVRALAEGATKA